MNTTKILFGSLLLAGMMTATSCKKEDKNDAGDKETPVVGNTSLGSVNFGSSTTFSSSSKNQEYPTIMNGGIVWAESPNPSSIKFAEINGAYGISGSVQEVIANTGTLSGPNDIDVTGIFEANQGKYVVTYVHGQNGAFALKAKVFESGDMNVADFNLEGNFQFANERPRYPKLATDGSGKIAVVYHSSSGTATPSSIRFKTIDLANGNAVSPAASSTQTGNVISGTDSDALFPSIAWNSEVNAYGVVYMIGTGNNRQIRYVKVDANGGVLAGPVTVTNGAGFETQNPKIQADGNGFVISWRDFRTVQIGNAEPVQGVPAIRLAVINDNGVANSYNGTAAIYDAADKSLLVSNPYAIECGMYHELVVKSPGKYGLAFATQTSPYQIYFSEVQVNGSTLEGTVQKNISNSNLTEDRHSLRYENGKYVIFLSGQKTGGTGYEVRRIVSQ
jgi:hypothetical protein